MTTTHSKNTHLLPQVLHELDTRIQREIHQRMLEAYGAKSEWIKQYCLDNGLEYFDAPFKEAFPLIPVDMIVVPTNYTFT